ncbi:hypothetical protein HAX54_011984 [Datura stramonium]|uniref:Uncharacterized protein n=1 Tax=Datura stramonium TaxID=4076 RepID=A0ABS8TKX7_DATST|nr:hypothetical protein [Datura stramonium]
MEERRTTLLFHQCSCRKYGAYATSSGFLLIADRILVGDEEDEEDEKVEKGEGKRSGEEKLEEGVMEARRWSCVKRKEEGGEATPLPEKMEKKGEEEKALLLAVGSGGAPEKGGKERRGEEGLRHWRFGSVAPVVWWFGRCSWRRKGEEEAAADGGFSSGFRRPTMKGRKEGEKKRGDG